MQVQENLKPKIKMQVQDRLGPRMFVKHQSACNMATMLTQNDKDLQNQNHLVIFDPKPSFLVLPGKA